MAGPPRKQQPTAAGPGGPRLPPRLAAVAAALPDCPAQVVADIATGRAELAVHLAATGRARRVIAIDRSPKAVAIATQLLLAHGVADRVTLRAGDGPRAVDADEADVVVMAGIGGRLMRNLLRRDAAHLVQGDWGPLLVLQPQSEPRLVRDWVVNCGREFDYVPVAEALVRDAGRYYHILSARRRKPPASPAAIEKTVDWLGAGFAATVAEVGPMLFCQPDPLLAGYLLWRAEALSNLATKASGSGSPAGLCKADAAACLAAEFRLAAKAVREHTTAPSRADNGQAEAETEAD